jgi:transcriptional regulator with XRE-family HTH domain
MNSKSNKSLSAKLHRPKYRDAFIAANVGVQIASQLHALRISREKSQDKLADEMGMNQATISLMEKPDYRKYNIGTLIRFAQHYKVALDVRFVSLVDHVKRILNETPDSLAPAPFDEPSAMPTTVGIPEVAAVQESVVSTQDVTELPPLLNKMIRRRHREERKQEPSDLRELEEAHNGSL